MMFVTSARKIVLIVSLFSLAALVGACGAGDPGTGVRALDVNTAAEIFENQPEDLVVIDVRTPEEFNEGHLEGAVLIDYYTSEFAGRLNELDRDQPYLVYCRSGNRSRSASQIMEELGFTNVVDVGGGFNAWLDNGHPFVQ